MNYIEEKSQPASFVPSSV